MATVNDLEFAAWYDMTWTRFACTAREIKPCKYIAVLIRFGRPENKRDI